jgi:SAM-dependent methyltransferase
VPGTPAVTVEWRPDLGRSVRLFRAFRQEQVNPELFYSALAQDSVAQLSQWTDVSGRTVVDVGGGPGHFAREFAARGGRYVVLDPDLSEIYSYGRPAHPTVVADGMRLPVADGAVDVAFSSNALEHVPDPERFADELVRITRPGGLIYLAYTNWLSPNGGHETGPWHLLLGGRGAARRYERRTGHRPKNDFGRTLFAVSAARMLHWARDREAAGAVEVVTAIPRYHPRWAQPVIRVPAIRELLCWNVLLVLRRLGPAGTTT